MYIYAISRYKSKCNSDVITKRGKRLEEKQAEKSMWWDKVFLGLKEGSEMTQQKGKETIRQHHQEDYPTKYLQGFRNKMPPRISQSKLPTRRHKIRPSQRETPLHVHDCSHKQAIWGHIWKRTVEKSQMNATNVTLHPHRQEIWGDIWKSTVGKN